MPFSTHIDAEQGVIIRVAAGSPSVEEIKAEVDLDFDRPGFRPNLNVLWDFTGARLVHLCADDLKELNAHFVKRMEGRGAGFKSALVVSADVDYGVLRMFDVYAENLPLLRRVCRSLDEAWEWLLE